MSFFDKFKQQAGNVAGAASGIAQNAVKQTKSLASVGRIKVAISAEEDKMKKAYTELGRLYYRDCEAQTEPAIEEYQPWIDKIADAKAQIDRLNEEAAKVRAAAAPEAEEEPAEEAEETVEVPEDAEAVAEVIVEEFVEEAPEEDPEPNTTAYEIFPEEPTVDTLYVDTTNTEE